MITILTPERRLSFFTHLTFDEARKIRTLIRQAKTKEAIERLNPDVILVFADDPFSIQENCSKGWQSAGSGGNGSGRSPGGKRRCYLVDFVPVLIEYRGAPMVVREIPFLESCQRPEILEGTYVIWPPRQNVYAFNDAHEARRLGKALAKKYVISIYSPMGRLWLVLSKNGQRLKDLKAGMVLPREDRIKYLKEVCFGDPWKKLERSPFYQ